MTEEQKKDLKFNEIKDVLPLNYSIIPISELEQLIEQGSLEKAIPSMHELVRRYSFASSLIKHSPDPNPKEALKWVKKLVDNNDWQGRHWLTDHYFLGEHNNPPEPEKAVKLLEKNAAEGDYLAFVRLAYYYADGKGGGIDFSKAVNWLTKMVSYENSNPAFKPQQSFNYKMAGILSCQFYPEFTYYYEEPRYKLAELYLQGGFGIDQNFGKAVEWLGKANNWSNIPYGEKCRAKFGLGKCYLTGGTGLEKSYAKAIEWFKEIPEPAEPLQYDGRWRDDYHVSEDEKYRYQAQRQLGLCHALGKGVEQNFAEAKKYFEKAARTSSVNDCDIRSMVDPCAEAELGICHYQLGEIYEARKCYESSARNSNILGNLWLCYLNSRENDELRCNIKYVPILFRTIGNPFNQLSNDELQSNKIDEVEREIDRRLRDIAVSVESQVHKEEELNLDMLNVSDEVIQFLINRKNNLSTNPSKVILALYYQSINNEDFLKYLKQASDHGDVIANYHLGKHYKYSNYGEAEKILQRVASGDVSCQLKDNYPLGTRKELRYLAKGDLKDISHQKEIELARQKLTDLVRSTSHTAGNLLRPNTQVKIAERLKKGSNFQEDANKLYYAASDIKYVKQQFKLLEIMQTLTGSQTIIDQIQLDRVKKDNDRAMNIDDILNMAAFRAIDKVFDQYEYSLDFARETLRKKVQNFDSLYNEYQDLVFKTNKKPSIISWCSDYLRPVKISYECVAWKKLYFYENSQTVALFFCYFFELFFNAFKYADHNSDDFLMITLGMETIGNQDFLTMHWKNPVGTQESFGSGKGLNLSESYISLLNDDAHKHLSQQISGFSNNVFELIIRISKKNMMGE